MEEPIHLHHRHHGRHFANRPAEVFGQEMPVQYQPIARPAQMFHPLPAPTGSAPYHLSLSTILPSEQLEHIRSSGRIVFHTAGDTGESNHQNHNRLSSSTWSEISMILIL